MRPTSPTPSCSPTWRARWPPSPRPSTRAGGWSCTATTTPTASRPRRSCSSGCVSWGWRPSGICPAASRRGTACRAWRWRPSPRRDRRCSSPSTAGSTIPDEVALAKASGLDVVVVDHHQPGPVLPDCHLIHEVVGDYPHGDSVRRRAGSQGPARASTSGGGARPPTGCPPELLRAARSGGHRHHRRPGRARGREPLLRARRAQARGHRAEGGPAGAGGRVGLHGVHRLLHGRLSSGASAERRRPPGRPVAAAPSAPHRGRDRGDRARSGAARAQRRSAGRGAADTRAGGRARRRLRRSAARSSCSRGRSGTRVWWASSRHGWSRDITGRPSCWVSATAWPRARGAASAGTTSWRALNACAEPPHGLRRAPAGRGPHPRGRQGRRLPRCHRAARVARCSTLGISSPRSAATPSSPGEDITADTALALNSLGPFGSGNPKPRLLVVGRRPSPGRDHARWFSSALQRQGRQRKGAWHRFWHGQERPRPAGRRDGAVGGGAVPGGHLAGVSQAGVRDRAHRGAARRS